MSAQSVEAITESGYMDLEPLPDWVIPPPGGYTADDFLRMQGLPRHTELIDGSLVFVGPQRKWHVRVIDLLRRTAEAYERDEPSTYYNAEDLVLAVEAVSPDSVERDRESKPRRYAAAGVRHLWRVEENEGRTVVYVYEYEPAGAAYALTGIHHDQLKVTVPFDIEIDPTAVGERS